MKRLLLIFFLITTKNCFSQITLYQSNMPLAGESFSVTDFNTSSFNPGSPGANQTWNFSNLPVSGPSITETFVNPAFTPNGAYFPSSNLAVPPDTQNLNYYYIDNASYNYLGYSPDSTASSFAMVLNDNEKVLKFPFTYMNAFTDSFNSLYQYGLYLDTLYGNTSVTADGFGTLILPNGTFYNTLRIKTIRFYFDSSYNAAAIPYEAYDTIFRWYDLSNHQYLFNYEHFVLHWWGMWIGDRLAQSHLKIATGINFYNLNENSFSISPNPASSGFQISNFNFQKGDEIILTDALGKTYFTRILISPIANFQLPVANFSNGIYFLEVKTKEGVLNKKVVVQHP